MLRIARTAPIAKLCALSARRAFSATPRSLNSTMRGLQYHAAEDIRYNKAIPQPAITKPDDVVIKIAYCGICGSDLHEYEHPIFFESASKDGDKISGKKLPLVLGHEMSGVVEAIGDNVKDLKPGDHVVVEATGHCSDRQNYFTEKENKRRDVPTCQSCELGFPNTCSDLNFLGLGVDNGGLAEYTKYSQEHVLKISDKIPLDVAALVEPLSVVWHAVQLSGFQPGEDALVLGAGPIGLATTLVLQAHGAAKVVVSEPASIRRDQAVKLGAIGFNPAEHGEAAISNLRKQGIKMQGFAKSFDCSGIQATYTTSIQALRARGVACNIAIWPHKSVATFVMDLTLEERTSVGSLGYTTKDFKGVINAIEKGDIDVDKLRTFITGKVGYKNAVKDGFLELINNKDKHIKILISPEISDN